MAEGLATGLEPESFDRHHFGAVQHDEAVRRTHELDVAPSGA